MPYIAYGLHCVCLCVCVGGDLLPWLGGARGETFEGQFWTYQNINLRLTVRLRGKPPPPLILGNRNKLSCLIIYNLWFIGDFFHFRSTLKLRFYWTGKLVCRAHDYCSATIVHNDTCYADNHICVLTRSMYIISYVIIMSNHSMITQCHIWIQTLMYLSQNDSLIE